MPSIKSYTSRRSLSALLIAGLIGTVAIGCGVSYLDDDDPDDDDNNRRRNTACEDLDEGNCIDRTDCAALYEGTPCAAIACAEGQDDCYVPCDDEEVFVGCTQAERRNGCTSDADCAEGFQCNVVRGGHGCVCPACEGPGCECGCADEPVEIQEEWGECIPVEQPECWSDDDCGPGQECVVFHTQGEPDAPDAAPCYCEEDGCDDGDCYCDCGGDPIQPPPRVLRGQRGRMLRRRGLPRRVHLCRCARRHPRARW